MPKRTGPLLYEATPEGVRVLRRGTKKYEHALREFWAQFPPRWDTSTLEGRREVAAHTSATIMDRRPRTAILKNV